ncbi:hypothetical protein RJT34_16831 [Clitoria ternatea]|uniref:Uncharacterized protein n=1 Tax=Clitoria ternatea TaxID=43366 RepID=A0AAN9JAY4_CLITE
MLISVSDIIIHNPIISLKAAASQFSSHRRKLASPQRTTISVSFLCSGNLFRFSIPSFVGCCCSLYTAWKEW